LGEFGQADYCGANAFLDAFAQSRAAGAAPHTVVINWDIWQEAGLAVHTEVPAHLRQWRQEMLAKGILNSEGVEVFERILASGLPQVVVSTQDLPGRIELGKSFTGESFLEELRKSGEAHPAAAPSRRVLGTGYVAAAGNLEQEIAAVWQRVLGAEQVGVNDNFFDLGGNSLLGLQLVSELGRELGLEVAPVTLFEFPTVGALSRHLNPQPEEPAAAAEAETLQERKRRLREGAAATAGIAVVGMAGRFPGAENVEELWSNLCEGNESVTFFTDEELLAAGVPQAHLSNPRYVRAAAVLEDVEQFDAELFGFSPREAEVMDPQHRIFLECAWEVLERAGYDSERYAGLIGVFAGTNLSTYLLRLHADPKVRESVNMLQAILGNDKDSLTTMVSYKLNLRGPSVGVQTFCSTSLVAIHMACQSLRTGDCDMALAGGIRVVVPSNQGYIFERGGLAPSDGHTRSFDAKADGSILGNGVGVVCLKRLEDALADGDHVHAVIKGSAVNNDGSLKAGYTAPSVQGQADAILAALDEAGVSPDEISYVEAHGSATELGDPIEVAALTKAFRARTAKKGFCPIGSVKANFGHLDRAAGVTALIKTSLSLEQRRIPPSINYDESNPQIDFANSPFYVNTSLAEWRADGAPRRACVNSLG
ncbi:MAG TPA: beta-ketoacyl synthase N-terminal-like domain-containing protein, partial [Pyrinomonadaceae bacterium]